MSGAIRLAARAALAAGAGYVHAVSAPATITELRTAEPDVLTQPCALAPALEPEVADLLARADAVVVGPGLGRGEGRREFVASVLGHARCAVVDADALTVFQGRTELLADAVRGRAAVLTPHPGEFRALAPDLEAGREVDPWSAAAAAADRLGATILLKGVPTVIFAPATSGWTVAAGNPGLGSGGSGDVLSGICGTFLAQLRDPLTAPVLAAQAMGSAGDIAARRQTARSMRPMDTVAALRDVWREWALLRGSGHAVRPPLLAELPRPAVT
jgi:NAD(P)H-hydrate epimerase